MAKLGALGLTVGVAAFAVACGGSSDSGLGTGDAGTGGSAAGSGGSAGSAGNPGGSAGAGASGGAAGGGGVAGSSGGASGNAGAGATGGGPQYTLDNFCEKAVPQICAGEKDCCTNSGYGYDQAKCESNGMAECMKDIAAVKAGNITFDPTNTDACLAAYTKYLKQCVVTLKDLPSFVREFDVCAPIFEGKLKPGDKCERDAQCASAADPNSFSTCDDDTKVCRVTTLWQESETCALGKNVDGVCDKGLYCDASLLTLPPYKGICKKATPLGQPCNKFNPYTLECGLGYYCNTTTGVCTVGKVGGAACVNDVECQSFSCTLLKCAATPPLVTQEGCTG
ncbi:MAG: hypothetical protein R3B13_08850 [Polyangiaceae bacterium]